MRDLGQLTSSSHDRKVAGVAGGLARHLDIDPLILRVAFVVLVFFGGAGLILYGACWLLVPDEETGEAPVTLDDRSRTVALLVVGALAAFALIGDSWGVFWFPWPLAIIAHAGGAVLRDPQGPERPAERTVDAAAPDPGDAVRAGRADRSPASPRRTTPRSPRSGTRDLPATPATQASPSATGTRRPGPVPVQRQTPRDPRPRPDPLLVHARPDRLGIGVVGTLDVAGVAVADSASPAVAVGVTGVMLLIGASTAAPAG